MKAIDLFLETASAFNANRARSLLTVLGIVIGIGAVIAMTSLIGGVKGALVGEMGLSQARLVNIQCYYNRPMNATDVSDMAKALGNYFEVITPESYGSAEVASEKEKATGYITGVNADYADAMGLSLAEGRFFTQSEASSGGLVAVIDQAGIKTLFGSANEQAVGRAIRIGSSEYEIVGVVQSTSARMDSGSVNLYLPFATCAQRINGNTDVSLVVGLAREDVDVEQAAKAAEDWLVQRYRIPESDRDSSLFVITMRSIIEQLDAMMASFQILMTAVASISLLVGGIGIMNMMLTNVTERIREIGLRKALGARRRDITRQFLLESICLTLAGGVIGIFLGLGGAYALAGLAGNAMGVGEGMTITPAIDLGTVVMVATICVIIGIIFGYYPARRAAKLDPVESLRYQ